MTLTFKIQSGAASPLRQPPPPRAPTPRVPFPHENTTILVDR